jgi:hypothetical protein
MGGRSGVLIGAGLMRGLLLLNELLVRQGGAYWVV